MIFPLNPSINPDLKIAALITNIHPKVIVAGWLKPEKPSSGFKTPDIIKSDMMIIDVVSIVKYSFTKRIIPMMIMAKVMYKYIFNLKAMICSYSKNTILIIL